MTDPKNSTTEDLKQEAKTATADLKESARETASEAVGTVRDEAARRAENAKSGVADEVSDVASALRKAAKDMRGGSPQERTFGQIAGGLADLSDEIRNKDLGEMATQVSDFAKRNPLLFLGGAALAGFAATRFATASARRDVDDAPERRVSATSAYTGTRPNAPAVQTDKETRPDQPIGATHTGGVS
ncbi:hypothetical protein [Roseovarius nanhaiticus]|uniref:hypothetical protein n=1 Tax=Roseovarius nanhaiticus TaxID=573024 RepID=UPI0024911C14|nr:hypothetical protein [Roseovarius nanhaiticus]